MDEKPEKAIMKIPNSLKIGGHTYQVILRNREKEDGNSNLGSCNNHLHKIWLDTEVSNTLQEETFLHEIIEALNYNYQLEMSHQTITILTTIFYQVLKDNDICFKTDKNI